MEHVNNATVANGTIHCLIILEVMHIMVGLPQMLILIHIIIFDSMG